MLGTDYPFPLGELNCGHLIESMDEFGAEVKVKSFCTTFDFLHALFYVMCSYYE